jgi:Putative beta-barrel porin-2, OmpL-like. bbp2
MTKQPSIQKTLLQAKPFRLTACLGTALLASMTPPAFAEDAARLDKLEQENQALRKRLDDLEQLAKKEGILAGSGDTNSIKAMSPITISGFVTASYFFDSSDPKNGISPGYLWNRKDDSFAINKVKLTLASPAVERSGDQFDVGYRASLIFGQDAPIVNSGSKTIGFSELREAFVEMNVPIGTGLNVKIGELISLLNYESGDGGAANNNFSQGYQWFFTGNGPAAGVQLGYSFTDWLTLTVREQNGLYAGPIDNNNSKTTIVSLGLKPTSDFWINFLGFGGREDSFAQSVLGGSVLAGWSATSKLGFGTELDYFQFYNPAGVTPSGHSPVWSTGLWVSYDFTKTFGAAVRGEFLSDKDGVDASGGALGFGNAPGVGQDISSLAFTLNYKPAPAVKIQPEIRYDHTSLANNFGHHEDRVIVGVGVSYLF